MLLRDRLNLVPLCAAPENIHPQYRPGPVGEGGLNAVNVDIQGIRIDVHEDRARTLFHKAVSGRDETERRRDYLVAGTKFQRTANQVEGTSTAVYGYGVAPPDVRSHGGLERVQFRPKAQVGRRQNLTHRLLLDLPEHLFGEVQRLLAAVGHSPLYAPTRRSGRVCASVS